MGYRLNSSYKTAWSVTANGYYSSTTQPIRAINCVDTTGSDYWQSPSAPTPANPQWIRLDFGSPTSFNFLGIEGAANNNTPKDIELWTSDDDISFTKIWNGVCPSVGSQGYASIILPATYTARYVKLVITSNWMAGVWTMIVELEIFLNTFGSDTTYRTNTTINSRDIGDVSPSPVALFEVPTPEVGRGVKTIPTTVESIGDIDAAPENISGDQHLGDIPLVNLAIVPQPFMFDLVNPASAAPAPTSGQLFPTRQ